MTILIYLVSVIGMNIPKDQNRKLHNYDVTSDNPEEDLRFILEVLITENFSDLRTGTSFRQRMSSRKILGNFV